MTSPQVVRFTKKIATDLTRYRLGKIYTRSKKVKLNLTIIV